MIGGDSSRDSDTVASASITLTSEDLRRIQLSVDDTSIDETETDGATVNVTATMLDGTVGTNTTVTLTFAGTAGHGTDYTASGSVTIPANTSSFTQEITITPIDNRIVEAANKTIIVGGTATNFRVLDAATIELVNNDIVSTEITLSATPDRLPESAGSAVTVTAELNAGAAASDLTVMVSLSSVSGGATAGDDYRDPGTLTLTIPARSVSGTVSFDLDPVDDNRDEDDEQISIGGSSSLTVNGTSVVLTDDDTASNIIDLSVSPARIGEGASATPVTVTATLRGPATRAVDTPLVLAVVTGSTADGTDYTITGLGSVVTMAAGMSSVVVTGVSITPTPDDEVERDETIVIGGSVQGFTVNRATITLVDDDSPSTSVTLSVDAANASISEEAGGVVGVPVTAVLDGGLLDRDVTVSLTFSGTATRGRNTADPGADYLAAPVRPVVTIPAGQRSAVVVLGFLPLDDLVDEGDGETIVVGGTASGRLGVNAATITLADDDTLTQEIDLTVSDSSVGEDESSAAVVVTATLRGEGARTTDTRVGLSLGSAGTASAGVDYRMSPDPLGTVVIPAGEFSGTGTIRVRPIQDREVEGADETIVVRGTLKDFTVNPATINLVDDDSPSTSVTLRVSSARLSESSGRRTIRVTADLDGGTRASDVEVRLSLSGSAEGGGVDYAASGEPLDSLVDIVIEAGEPRGFATFDLDLVDDRIDEDDGEVIVVGGTATVADGGEALSVNGAAITISDNDTVKPEIVLSVGPPSLDESTTTAQTVTVNATLQGDVALDTDVEVSLTLAGTAESGADYTASAPLPTVTIPARGFTSTAVTFTITPAADTVAEGNETIDVIGTAAGFKVVGDTVNLLDDDVETPPEVTDLDLTPRGGSSVTLRWDQPASTQPETSGPSTGSGPSGASGNGGASVQAQPAGGPRSVTTSQSGPPSQILVYAQSGPAGLNSPAPQGGPAGLNSPPSQAGPAGPSPRSPQSPPVQGLQDSEGPPLVQADDPEAPAEKCPDGCFHIQEQATGSLWVNGTPEPLSVAEVCTGGRCAYTVTGLDTSVDYQWRVVAVDLQDDQEISSEPSATARRAVAVSRPPSGGGGGGAPVGGGGGGGGGAPEPEPEPELLAPSRLQPPRGGDRAPLPSDVSPEAVLAGGILAVYRLGVMTLVSIDPGPAGAVRGFAPERSMSRADVAAPLVRLWQVLDRDCPTTASAPFEDIDDPQLAADAGCLRGIGVTNGTTATTYSPERLVTRAQTASLLIRVWRLLGRECPDDDAPPFDDVPAGSVHHDDVLCLRGLGITRGVTATTFAPVAHVTRAEFATMLTRLHNLINPPESPDPEARPRPHPEPQPDPEQQADPESDPSAQIPRRRPLAAGPARG